MTEHVFNQATLDESVDKISAAMTLAARDTGAIPAACRVECSVSIGPDGQPVYTCRVVCDF